MKLGSLRTGDRDGQLVVVSRDLSRAVAATGIAQTLQQALEQWDHCAARLASLADALQEDQAEGSFALDLTQLMAPMPRAYQFVDGSAYLPHVERVRKARGAEVPASFATDPLMYQAVSDGFLAAHEDIAVANEDWGIDFESEIGVFCTDLPMGASVADCEAGIALITLINDVSLRNLIPNELAKGFGFLHSKPRSALAPVAVTPDELGSAWRDCKVHRPLHTWLNGALFGQPEAGEDMQFSFAELLAHAAHSRPLLAGTLLGSGTVANQDASRGASCLAEKRMLEIIEHGQASTPFMRYGDRVRIDLLDSEGHSLCGAIDQQVVPYQR